VLEIEPINKPQYLFEESFFRSLITDISAGGGEMIADVFQDKSTYAEPPSR
jgi:hypothetical protein